MKIRLLLVLSLFATSALHALPVAPSTPMSDAEKAQYATHVKAETLRAWNAYKKYAWGHDELHPLTHEPFDWYGHSLLMTPVDALDTLVIMDLKPQADEAHGLIDTQLNFDQDIYVKDFEITIRMIGGLLSSYQLTGDKRLLELADDLGHRMLPMFNSPTGMPWEYINLHTGAVRGNESNPAEVGTMLIEYGMLSRLTGKPEYYDKAKRAMVELYNRRSAKGLFGSTINIETGKWLDSTATIQGGTDSFYEYMAKAAILFDDKDCAKMWQESLPAINQYLADERPTGLWYGEADMNTGARTGATYGALDAFFPAVLVLSNEIDRAAKLQDSGYKMWNVAGIEPERFDYAKMKIVSPEYPLRPEIIESTYYLYHATHDAKYLAMGKTYFDNIMRYCRTSDAFAALKDVRTKKKTDSMESFFFAETLKYLYLLFSPESTLDFDSIIFNTEAHPMKKSLAAAH
ncbi:glycoside hydrolase family 47 protein [Acidicapsa dinghuensis]|uniref:Glycoside hydrolase family 47 protein n=1 Tax=Acidicapsa dinghuensis TaxID=2218256 RepID=A0ABW1EN17_9BACT|nr:glycoside hydrolase family 47 protein [Acidicapsa dinghuensis]